MSTGKIMMMSDDPLKLVSVYKSLTNTSLVAKTYKMFHTIYVCLYTQIHLKKKESKGQIFVDM